MLNKSTYQAVIGLEVHARLKTKTKLFCGCRNEYGQAPNTLVCPVCAGYPGALPVLNKRAVELAVLAGLAFNCEINRQSVFARKNYFYPDLPKGYQITQHEFPVCGPGFVEIINEGAKKRIKINLIHLEEDSGKLIHGEDEYSLADYNRSGTPLIEIVSAPDISSPDEAARYLKILKQILEYCDISDCNMEQGSFRVDANISLKPAGREIAGIRTEIKNLNSFRFVRQALDYEIKRQSEILGADGQVIQQTLLWDREKGVTIPMRSKEESEDYRYFPDPDLPPLVIDDNFINHVKSALPELPGEKKKRLMREYKLRDYDAGILTESADLADFFEETAKLSGNPKQAANRIITDVLKIVNSSDAEIENLLFGPEELAQIISIVDKEIISDRSSKIVFEIMADTGRKPEEIIETENLAQISDEGIIEKMVKSVLEKYPEKVKKYRNGKTGLAGFLTGEVMKISGGRVNPVLLNEKLREYLR